MEMGFPRLKKKLLHDAQQLIIIIGTLLNFEDFVSAF